MNSKNQSCFPLHEILYGGFQLGKKEIYLLSLTNSGNYITSNDEDRKKGVLQMLKNKEYNIFKRVIENYLIDKHKSKPENIKLIVVLSEIKNKNKTVFIDF